MKTRAYFVTPDDFLNYYNIDLNETLRDNDTITDSNKADNFLMHVEERLLNWVDSNTWRNYRWEDLTGDKKEAVQKAILIQAMYVFRNSDISTDSGYNPQTGVVISKENLQRIEICDAAIDMLKANGLFNHVMSNRRRYSRWH